jgi:O-antigen/teichoic acid export membrane protein
MTSLAILVSVAAYSAGAWIVALVYGGRYVEAAPAFQVLALAFPLLALNYALTHQLILWEGHVTYAIVCAAALVVNVGGNVVLIPRLGISGAAWATILTELVVTLGCVWGLSRVGPMKTDAAGRDSGGQTRGAAGGISPEGLGGRRHEMREDDRGLDAL